jgi:hypothetical protein
MSKESEFSTVPILSCRLPAGQDNWQPETTGFIGVVAAEEPPVTKKTKIFRKKLMGRQP